MMHKNVIFHPIMTNTEKYHTNFDPKFYLKREYAHSCPIFTNVKSIPKRDKAMRLGTLRMRITTILLHKRAFHNIYILPSTP